MSTASELVAVPKLDNKSPKTDINDENNIHTNKLDLKVELNTRKENENGVTDDLKK